MNRSQFIRKAIIDAYLRVKEDERVNPVRSVAVSLGYSIDENGCNSFVASVIRTFERQK